MVPRADRVYEENQLAAEGNELVTRRLRHAILAAWRAAARAQGCRSPRP
jgi:hypothetical protein